MCVFFRPGGGEKKKSSWRSKHRVRTDVDFQEEFEKTCVTCPECIMYYFGCYAPRLDMLEFLVIIFWNASASSWIGK